MLELGLKYVQSYQERQHNYIVDVVLEPCLLTLNIFLLFPSMTLTV